LYYSPNIRVTESRGLRWMGLVARIGKTKNAYIISVGNLKHETIWKT